MDVFCIKIANLCVKVEAQYPLAREKCRDYLTSDEDVPDITASVAPDEIEQELARYGEQPTRDYCEFICLYRSIAEKLPLRDRIVFHGAAVEIDGRGFIFTAPSGTGKSTHVRLLRERFGDRVRIVNGDKPIISLCGESPELCSAPWAGKEGWQRNVSVPLCGICILSRSEYNFIERAAPSDCFDTVMRQVYFPSDPASRIRTLELLDLMSSNVSFYRLGCDISHAAAEVSFGELSRE